MEDRSEWPLDRIAEQARANLANGWRSMHDSSTTGSASQEGGDDMSSNNSQLDENS